MIFFSAAFFAVSVRLFYIQVVKYDFYKGESNEQHKRIIILAADRGDIIDRTGSVLATSIDSSSVFAIPAKIKNKDEAAGKLSKALKVTKYSVLNKLYSEKHFVWIERKTSKFAGDKVLALKLEGIGVLTEKKRLYPKGKLASQILGFVGLDNQGLSGIELGFDKYLRGVEGMLITESDPSGRELVGASPREIQAPAEGLKIVLSLDEVIQHISERELLKTIKEHKAKSGTIIVMDVETGEILAIASKPDFDPNTHSDYSSKLWQSRAALDVYEPGSTFKLVTVASALNAGAIKKNETIDCPYYMKIGGKTINNSHRLKDIERVSSISDVLARSINTGTVKIAMKLGDKKFYEYIKAFGFGEKTGIGIPGETRGILRDVANWSKPDIAVISFGHGIAVTPLQMLSSVVTIVNDGVRIKPRLINKVESVDGSFVRVFHKQELGRVISSETAKDLKEMMLYVCETGTGKYAKIHGFSVGGKTGTAQKVRPGGHGYWPGHYVASFVGVAPIISPKIAALVIIDDPVGVHWGEKVAAPAFANVVEDTLRYLNVKPDRL